MGTEIKKSGYLIVQDESIDLPLRNTIDFQGAGVNAQDIGGKTIVFIPSIPSLQDWVPNNPYLNGAYVVAKYENEYRVWRAITNFTSGAGVFPAGNTIATDINGYVGQWQEVSPLRGSMGNMTFNNSISFNSTITPPAITIDTHNYNPTGLAACNFIRMSASSALQFTGLKAPVPVTSQAIFICNVGVSQISLISGSVASTAGNRFLLGGTKTLQNDEGIMLIYDSISLCWRSQALNI